MRLLYIISMFAGSAAGILAASDPVITAVVLALFFFFLYHTYTWKPKRIRSMFDC